MEGYTTQLMVCVCVCVRCESGGLKKELIFGIKCFSKAISLHFLFAPILLFQHVYKYHGLLCYIDHLVTQISCARQNAMTGGIQEAVTLVHLQQQGCSDAIQHTSNSSSSGRAGGETDLVPEYIDWER